MHRMQGYAAKGYALDAASDANEWLLVELKRHAEYLRKLLKRRDNTARVKAWLEAKLARILASMT